MDNHVVAHAVQVRAPADAVWRALTDPAALIQWYAPGCRWEIPDLREGAPVRFYNTETDIQAGTIERLEPGRVLVIRWVPDPAFPGASLLNTYVLHDDGTHTVVTITQSGYESAPVDRRAAWIEADSGAFPAIAAALARFVDASDAGLP